MKTDEKQRRSGGCLAQLMKPGAEESFFRNDMLALKGTVFGTARRKGAYSEEDKQKYIEAWSQPKLVTFRHDQYLDTYPIYLQLKS